MSSPVQSLILHFNQSFHYSIFTLKDINSIFMLLKLGNGFYKRFSKCFPGEINSIFMLLNLRNGFYRQISGCFPIYTTVKWQFHLNIWLHYGSGISTNGSYNINECTLYICPLRTKAYRWTRNYWPVVRTENIFWNKVKVHQCYLGNQNVLDSH